MNRETGLEGEERAVEYLKSFGYTIISRNFRVRSGEIDIIATNDQEIIFAEVKFRKSGIFGGAISALPAKRIERLRNAALVYIGENENINKQVKLILLAIQGDKISEIALD
ncbi:MAG: YraN family protein [Caldisericia bacterium]|nr:YraN family protein [Caldisericia bacterium]